MTAPTLTCPAVLVLPEGAPRDVWLAKRTEGIGGSDIAGILGLSKWSSPYQVWADKTGRSVDEAQTWPMFRGTEDEPKLRKWFTRQKGIAVTTTGMWQSVEHPLAFANPDGFTGDGGGLECKSHNWRMGDEWSDDQVSDAAELQSQWYMAVTGRGHWWAIAQLGDEEPVIRRIARDQGLIDSLLATAEAFWHDYVLTDVAPPLVSHDLDAIRAQFSAVEVEAIDFDADDVEPLIADWQRAKAVEKAAKEAADLELARLRSIVAGAEAITVGGIPRLTCKANGTFAASRFATDHPDVAAECTKTVHVLDVDALKQHYPNLYQGYRARVLRAVTVK